MSESRAEPEVCVQAGALSASPALSPGRPALLLRLSLPLLLLSACVFNLLAIWSVDWLPLGDFGGHIELMDIVARYHDPATSYASVYTLPDELGPNTVSLLVAWLLAPTDVLWVAKALLSLYVLGLPLSVLLLARAFHRSPWQSLLACPLVFNATLNLGVLNWLLAFVLIVLCFALARLFAERGGWLLGSALTLALFVVLLTHVMAFLIAAAMSAAMLVLFATRWQALSKLLVLLPSLPIFGRWAWRMFVSLESNSAGRSFGTEEGLGSAYHGLGTLFAMFHTWGMQFFRDLSDELAFSVLALNWLLLMFWTLWRGRAHRASEPAKRPLGQQLLQFARKWALELSTLVCLAAYFSLPSDINEMAVINQRIVLLVMVLACAWPRLELRTPAQAMLFAPVALLALVYPWVVREHFLRFEREEVGDLPAIIAELPEHSRLAYVMHHRESVHTYMGPLWHIPKALHCLANGGSTDDSFAIRPYTPVQYKAGMAPPRLEHLGPHFVYQKELVLFDFLLLRALEPAAELEQNARLRLRARSGYWYLYEILGVDQSPRAFLPASAPSR